MNGTGKPHSSDEYAILLKSEECSLGQINKKNSALMGKEKLHFEVLFENTQNLTLLSSSSLC